MRFFANFARVLVLSTACVAAVGSATSSQNTGPVGNNTNPQFGPQGSGGGMSEPPPSQQMDPSRALGLWKSTFGAVKIEADNSKGGLQSGAVQGIWVYQRKGEEVVGYFAGSLHGNVLQFTWQEPNNPPLTGAGYIQFDASGRQYSGRWWSDHHDRVGDWNGWRSGQADSGMGAISGGGGDGNTQPQPQPYGGNGYGGYQQQPRNQYRYPQQQPPTGPYQQPYPPQQPQQYPPQQPQQYPPQQPQQYPPQQGPYQPPPAQQNPYGPQQPQQPQQQPYGPPAQQQAPRGYY